MRSIPTPADVNSKADAQASAPRRILVERGPQETRVAILEGGRLAEILFERDVERARSGWVYKARVRRVLPGMRAAFLDIGFERDAFLYAGDVKVDAAEVEDDAPPAVAPAIQDRVSVNEKLLVQVDKEPRPGKGARVTTEISLPGRFMVLIPGSQHRGVSRRIEDPEERERLRGLLEELPVEGGLIVRTAAAGRDVAELEHDVAELERQWRRLQENAATKSTPALVHRDLSLPERVIRDLLGVGVEVVWVEDGGHCEELRAYAEEIDPGLAERVREWREPESLFAAHNVEAQIEAATRRRAWLKSGGHIVIESTEALVAIDVNTGRFVGRHDLEQTVLETNLEAAEEIARQLRLRGLGGIIAVDFIDMEESANQQRVLAALEAALVRDRARSRVSGFSEFGLVEITRKRLGPPLLEQLTDVCPRCRGDGRVRSVRATSLALRREVLGRWRDAAGPVLVQVPPHLMEELEADDNPVLPELLDTLGDALTVECDPRLERHRFVVDGSSE